MTRTYRNLENEPEHTEECTADDHQVCILTNMTAEQYMNNPELWSEMMAMNGLSFTDMVYWAKNGNKS
jgi:hypothetical protein